MTEAGGGTGPSAGSHSIAAPPQLHMAITSAAFTARSVVKKKKKKKKKNNNNHSSLHTALVRAPASITSC